MRSKLFGPKANNFLKGYFITQDSLKSLKTFFGSFYYSKNGKPENK